MTIMMIMMMMAVILIIIIIIIDSRNHRVGRICFRNLEKSNFCFAEHRDCNGLTERTWKELSCPDALLRERNSVITV